MEKITIIGSGATGTLLAVNLIKHSSNAPLEINLKRAFRLMQSSTASVLKVILTALNFRWLKI